MTEVAVYEAKTRLSELLTDVEQGREITITRRGVAVARLVPMAATGRALSPAALQRKQVRDVFDALTAQRNGVSLDMPLRDAIDQGRD